MHTSDITDRTLCQALVTESHRAPACVAKVQVVAEYRAYLIKDKHVAAAPTLIEADTDDVAIEQAKQLVDGHDVELWQGPRFVIGLRSKDSDTEPSTTDQSASNVVCPGCSMPMVAIAIATADRVTGLREVIYRCEPCAAETIRVQKKEK